MEFQPPHGFVVVIPNNLPEVLLLEWPFVLKHYKGKGMWQSLAPFNALCDGESLAPFNALCDGESLAPFNALCDEVFLESRIMNGESLAPFNALCDAINVSQLESINGNYKQLIQRNFKKLLDEIDPQHIFPALYEHHTLSLDQLEEIKCQPSRYKKAEKLLTIILKENNRELYLTFSNALKKNGYEHLFVATSSYTAHEENSIETYLTNTTETYKQRNEKVAKYQNTLLNLFPTLLDKIEPEDVVSYLFQANVLNIDQMEEINNHPTRRAKVQTLLFTILHINKMNVYTVFVKALQKYDFEGLANMILNELNVKNRQINFNLWLIENLEVVDPRSVLQELAKEWNQMKNDKSKKKISVGKPPAGFR